MQTGTGYRGTEVYPSGQHLDPIRSRADSGGLYSLCFGQRGLHDGCTENVIALNTVSKNAKVNFVHVMSLDVTKAFDRVSHHALIDTLQRLGLSRAFVK